MKTFFQNNSQVFETLEGVLLAAVIMLITVLLVNIFRRAYNRFVIHTTNELNINPGQYVFIKHLITALIYVCGFGLALYMIPAFKQLSLSMFASSGILAIVLGFASQHSLANIISGMFITIFKPFKVTDRVKLMGKDITGVIEDITLRHTIIRTFENKRIIIPNSVISSEIIENANLIDDRICKFVEVGISYDSDMDKALAIMQEEALKHPDTIDNRKADDIEKGDPIVATRVIGFGDSSVNLRAWVWTSDQPTAFKLGCDLYKSIKERFDAEGIEIPFPHRTIVYKDSPKPIGRGL